ncbi:MAG: hypothetical protein N2257_10735 [Thermodesulfovibrionales bacterium]|nr:hypothetical protein [Thermodesulfovibrionales bacterium]
MREGAKKGTYIGIGAGLVLFAILGLMPGSFLGGVIGLNIAGALFGTPVSSHIIPRLIVGVWMLIGVVVTGVVFVTVCSIAGWLMGTVVDHVRRPAVKKEVEVIKNEDIVLR